MTPRVVVTGVGVISSLGRDPEEAFDACLRGTSGVREITGIDTSFPCRVAAQVLDFPSSDYFNDHEQRKLDRSAQFLLAAGVEAVRDAGLNVDDEDPFRVGVITGTGCGGIATLENEFKTLFLDGVAYVSPVAMPRILANMPGSTLAMKLGYRGVNVSCVTACASSLHAIGYAADQLRLGRADVILAGGTEACVNKLALAGFTAVGALSTDNEPPAEACKPFDARRKGIVLGEGAGILVMEIMEHAQARGARILAEIAGFGATADAYHMVAPEPRGEAAGRAMQAALRDAQVEPAEVDYINAHGTGTVIGDVAETRAIKLAMGEHASQIPISSTKPIFGHALGAAGALESIICLQAIRRGVLPPTRNYSVPDRRCDLDYIADGPRTKRVQVAVNNGFGFGGQNACVVFRASSPG